MRDVTDLVVRRQSGSRAVYDTLRTQIINGSLAAGQRLTEQQLCESFGISAAALREALRLLQAESLVMELPIGGVRVAPLDLADARRVYELRARLEGLLARDACIRAVPADVVHLLRLVDRMGATTDREDVALLGTQFHKHIEEIANNSWCSALLRQIRAHIDRYRAVALRDPLGTPHHIDDHLAIVEAISGRDADGAEATMRAHIERNGVRTEQALYDLARQPSGAIPFAAAATGRHLKA